MTNAFWKRVRGGTPSSRVFAIYVALVLIVAMVGPGLAVYAAEGEDPGVVPVETPAVEPVVEPVVEAAVEPVAEPVAEEAPAVVEAPPAEPEVEAAVPSIEAPLAPIAAAVTIVASVASSTDPSDLGVVPTVVGGNPALCVGGLRVDPGTSGTYAIPGYPGMFVTVVVTSTDDGPVFSFDSDVPVARVVAKGGKLGANIYLYDPAVTADGSLHTPINPSGFYAGISHIDFCFGEIQEPETGDLLIHKYLDENENGEYDEGEELLGDWEFTVTLETPPLVGDQQASAIMLIGQDVTDADGELLFTGLDPDHYTVRETLQTGWSNTTPLTQYADVVAGETAELWFGNIRDEVPPETGDLLIHKYLDENENGEFDEGEEMLEDWVFTVTQETEPLPGPSAAAIQLIGSGSTDVNGELLFTELLPGEYHVAETLQDGWDNTTPLTQVATVVAGETAELWFGNIEKSLPFTELDLAITKVADDHTVVEGQLVTYTLTYWNNGDLAAEGYSIVDDFDERYLTIVNSNGGVVAGGKITWMPAGSLAKADGKKTITYTARVIADMPDGTTNIDNVVVISHPRDTDPTNNRDDERIVVTTEPFLPFTGGEYLMLLGFAVAAAAIGLLLRSRTDTAA